MVERKVTGGTTTTDTVPEVMIDGVRFTHPDKVLWPEQGLTKRDLVTYYNQVADRILPHLANRPVTLLRCPSGRQAQCFIQRHAADGVPTAIRRIPVKEQKGTVDYLAVEDRRALLNLVQLGVLEIHPWGARADRLDRPDRITFDLDPADGVAWAAVVETAIGLRDRLAAIELESFVQVTGGRGVHIAVPVARRLDWEATGAFAAAVAARQAETNPKLLTTSSLKAQRIGRIYIDHQRNVRTATAVAPYSPRARSDAPVATPVTWDELTKLAGPAPFTVRTVPERLRHLGGDPWAAMLTHQQPISAAARKAVGAG